MSQQIICTKDQANYMLCMSHLTLLSFLYDCYMEYYKISLGSLCIWITSQLFWSNPKYDWKRTLDMITVNTVAVINMWIARNAENRVPFYINMGMCGVCFTLGLYYHRKNNLWLSIFWHSGVHVFGNLGNICLYSGKLTSEH